VLLALSTDLSTSFDFFPTFTDPFEVSNKVGVFTSHSVPRYEQFPLVRADLDLRGGTFSQTVWLIGLRLVLTS
jgi:hypothetical protein